MELCYLDFSEAFDSISKMPTFGRDERLDKWVEDFLCCTTFALGWVKRTLMHCEWPVGCHRGHYVSLLFSCSVQISCPPIELSLSRFAFVAEVKIVGAGNWTEMVTDLPRVLAWTRKGDVPINTNQIHQLKPKRE